MAGQEIYTSNMILSLEKKLDDTMSKIDDMITELGVVNDSVAQNLNILTVGIGSGQTHLITDPSYKLVTGNGVDGGVKTSLGKVKFLCNGACTISGYFLVGAPDSYHAGLWMKRNSDAWEKIITVSFVGGRTESAQIFIAYDDIVEFAIGGYESGVNFVNNDGLFMAYDIKNIAEDGAFVSK